MLERIISTLTVPAGDTNGVATAAAFIGGGVQAFTIDGPLASDFGVVATIKEGALAARTISGGALVSLTTSAADSARTVTLIGVGIQGETITEAVTLGDTTTVYSTTFYKSITSATIDDDAVGTVALGVGLDATNPEVAAPSVQLGRLSDPPFGLQVTHPGGTATYTVSATMYDAQNDTTAEFVPLTALDSKTTSLLSNISTYASGVRLSSDAGNDTGAVLKLVINQGRQD